MSNSIIKPSMLLISTSWQSEKSFSLIPADSDCPYVEVLFNPEAKALVIIGKTKKNTFHMVPRLSEDGDKIKSKSGIQEFKQQRIEQESYSEYYITSKEDIEKFVAAIAVNKSEFPYQEFIDNAFKPASTIIKPTLVK